MIVHKLKYVSLELLEHQPVKHNELTSQGLTLSGVHQQGQCSVITALRLICLAPHALVHSTHLI